MLASKKEGLMSKEISEWLVQDKSPFDRLMAEAKNLFISPHKLCFFQKFGSFFCRQLALDTCVCTVCTGMLYGRC